MELDPAAHADSMHRILTSVVVPRPIGWISTRAGGRDNLAPYSYFNAVSTVPPAVMFSATDRDGGRKDTARMALDAGEFVVNLVTEGLAAAMDKTAAPIDASEFDFAGLERAPSATVDAPRVTSAAAHLECTVHDSFRVHDNTLVVGDVDHIHVDDRLVKEGVVDAREVDAVGRLGGPYYTRIDRLDLERSHFGPWEGPAPPGFVVDDAGELAVDVPAFEALRRAVEQIEAGEPPDDVAADTRFDTEDLAAAADRRALYLEGRASDERIEAALLEADLSPEFVG